jgi:hypothetical protein
MFHDEQLAPEKSMRELDYTGMKIWKPTSQDTDTIVV